jgi:hypothetical protein
MLCLQTTHSHTDIAAVRNITPGTQLWSKVFSVLNCALRHEDVWKYGGIAAHIPDHDTRRQWVVGRSGCGGKGKNPSPHRELHLGGPAPSHSLADWTVTARFSYIVIIMKPSVHLAIQNSCLYYTIFCKVVSVLNWILSRDIFVKIYQNQTLPSHLFSSRYLQIWIKQLNKYES